MSISSTLIGKQLKFKEVTHDEHEHVSALVNSHFIFIKHYVTLKSEAFTLYQVQCAPICSCIIVLLRDFFHIGLVIVPRPAVLA